jgi:hypothetical protein
MCVAKGHATEIIEELEEDSTSKARLVCKAII